MAPGLVQSTKSSRLCAGLFAPPEYRSWRYAMLLCAWACQLATVLIAWPVWNVREVPVNLPLIDLPQFSFGVPVLLSLLLCLRWPRAGVLIHALVLGLSCLWDQYRLQPQVLSLVVLMAACTFEAGAWFARWYLAAMWFWAGLHKLLSREWLGWGSWLFLDSCGLPADDWHAPFAWLVALSEIALGCVAIARPRYAALGCVVLHLGVLVTLSPWLRNYNVSVWPWNIATAVVGYWLLRQEFKPVPRLSMVAVAGVLFVLPAGFYGGFVNPHLAFVLYSGNVPHAVHTTRAGWKRLEGWGGLTVPFPDSPRLFLEVFRRTALPGDKLFIGDPRPGLPTGYFIMNSDGTVEAISRDQFVHPADPEHEVSGRELATQETFWRLQRCGVTLAFEGQDIAYSATLSGEQVTDQVLERIGELPNLRELKIDGPLVTDRGLEVVESLLRLEILEVRHTQATEACLTSIARCRSLQWLQLSSLNFTDRELNAWRQLSKLQVLRLPESVLTEQQLMEIGRWPDLQWLDLHDARLPTNSLQHLAKLESLEWLDLSQTDITHDDLQSLAGLPALRTLQLNQTGLDDAALQTLGDFKQLEHLELRGTSISAEGRNQLEQALPTTQIVW